MGVIDSFTYNPLIKNIIALDVSKTNIGVAIYKKSINMSLIKDTIKRTKLLKDIDIIKDIIKKNDISLIVVGLPINKEGNNNIPRTQSIKTFAINLSKHIDTPITFYDERFSTKYATNVIKAKKNIDSYAAQFFLDGFVAQYINNMI